MGARRVSIAGPPGPRSGARVETDDGRGDVPTTPVSTVKGSTGRCRPAQDNIGTSGRVGQSSTTRQQSGQYVMNGRSASPGHQNHRFIGENPHGNTLRVGPLTGTVTKLLNRIRRKYLSQLLGPQPRRRVSAFYTLRT